MNKYKEEKIYEAPVEYSQYWHCDYANKGCNGYDVKYITTKPNPSNSYRGVFTSDRDRIMYTTCFLRLSSKTQIFRAGSNDHLRTRLTHTLEVSQIARTIAKELGLNIDLVEAISLGHDVGHTPFGHAGERQLNEISQNQLKNLKTKFTCNESPLENCNGFKHNQQSVRVLVDYSHDISLTNFCLYGIRNHSSLLYKDNLNSKSMSFYNRYDKYCSYQNNCNSKLFPSWSLEAVVVYWADEIAQRHHDIEDAYRRNLIKKDNIFSILKNLMDYFKEKDLNMSTNPDFDNYCQRKHFDEKLNLIERHISDNNKFSKNLSSMVVDFYVSAIIKEMLYAMDKLSTKYGINSHDDFVNKYFELPENEMWTLFKLKGAEAFTSMNGLFENKLKNIIMPSYDVQRQDGKGSFITRKLFNAYITNPQQLPDEYIKRIFNIEIPMCLNVEQLNIVRACLGDSISDDFVTWDIVTCRNVLNKLLNESLCSTAYGIIYPLLFRIIFDYISGMTDLFAQEEYRQLY